MTNTTMSSSLGLVPILKMPRQDVESSVDRFCLTAGSGAIEKMLGEVAQQFTGAPNSRGGSRSGYPWGRTKGKIDFHGGKVEVHCPRVRGYDGHEIALPTWTAPQAEDWLGRWAMNLMLINVSTRKFRAFMLSRGSKPTTVAEVVCDMSTAFLAAVAKGFPNAAVTVDWFHVVQLFTTAVDQVRKAEARSGALPKAVRWAVLKAGGRNLTDNHRIALAELETGGFTTAAAYRAKEMVCWIRQAESPQAGRWRITRFINHIGLGLDPGPLLDPVRRPLRTFGSHVERIIQRWTSSHSNARLEGLNGIFQAARARARGYRSTATYITIIYLLVAPLPHILKSI